MIIMRRIHRTFKSAMSARHSRRKRKTQRTSNEYIQTSVIVIQYKTFKGERSACIWKARPPCSTSKSQNLPSKSFHWAPNTLCDHSNVSCRFIPELHCVLLPGPHANRPSSCVCCL
ncbi:hypothetical protein BDR04DRAFT_178106 [Suillus decipiens]|nr:hypothetical protein BDR04DRAFT_178106 [Suillus decipiens]